MRKKKLARAIAAVGLSVCVLAGSAVAVFADDADTEVPEAPSVTEEVTEQEPEQTPEEKSEDKAEEKPEEGPAEPEEKSEDETTEKSEEATEEQPEERAEETVGQPETVLPEVQPETPAASEAADSGVAEQRICWHNYEEVSNTATCENAGLKTMKCTKCGHEYTVISRKLGHDFSINVPAVEPTCGQAGHEAGQKCSRCGKTVWQVLPATGKHKWEWETTLEPTCVENGLEKEVCSVCGQSSGATKVLPATGVHSWSDWEIVEEPTTEKEGLKTRRCLNASCLETQSEAIPKLEKNSRDDDTGAEFVVSTAGGLADVQIDVGTGAQADAPALTQVYGSTNFYGLRVFKGRLATGDEVMTVAIINDGHITRYNFEVTVSVEKSTVEGYDLMLVEADGSERKLTVNEGKYYSTFDVDLAEGARIIRLVPKA